MKYQSLSHHIPAEDDWSDLQLISNAALRTPHAPPSDQLRPEQETKESMSSVDLSYDIKMVEDLVMKDQKLGVFADIDNPVRNEIRKKIRESKDRNKVKIQALNDLANR